MGGVLCPTFVADMLVTAATAGSAGTKCPTSAPGKMRDRKGRGLASWAQEGGVFARECTTSLSYSSQWIWSQG